MKENTMVCEDERVMEFDERRVFAERVILRENTLYAIAYAMLRSQQDAMDAVQDAVTQGWMKRGALRDEGAFVPWLNRILINVCKNRLRSRKQMSELFDMPTPQVCTDDSMDIRCAMAALDDKTRVCAALFYYEDMTISDIADSLGVPLGTVKSRLNRARKKLRILLEVR